MHQLDLGELRIEIKTHIDRDQQKQKERYDRTRRDAAKYCDGDLVLVQVTSDSATDSSRKLHPKHKGPFRIHRVLLNNRYEVEDLREGSRRKRTVVAADKIKPWITIQGE